MNQVTLLQITEIAIKYVNAEKFGHTDAKSAQEELRGAGASGPAVTLALSLIMSFRSRDQTKQAEFDGILRGLRLGAALSDRATAPQITVNNCQEAHNMRDKYENSGQAGAIGPHSRAHDIQFLQQTWDQMGAGADPAILSDELGRLLVAMKADAVEPEQFEALTAVSRAKVAAEGGDGPGALAMLKSAGKWAAEVANKIGTALATEAIKKSLNL